MKKQPGDRLSRKQWQKLADLLMIARNDPLIDETGNREKRASNRIMEDKDLFQKTRETAVYYMCYAGIHERGL